MWLWIKDKYTAFRRVDDKLCFSLFSKPSFLDTFLQTSDTCFFQDKQLSNSKPNNGLWLLCSIISSPILTLISLLQASFCKKNKS